MTDCNACRGRGYTRPFIGTGNPEQRTCDRCEGDGIEPRDPDDGPTDDQLYNRHGMEGGIPYSTADTRDEHDPTL